MMKMLMPKLIIFLLSLVVTNESSHVITTNSCTGANCNKDFNVSIRVKFQDPASIQRNCGELNLRSDYINIPWHVTIYVNEYSNMFYQCAGNLISQNRILTTGYCVYTYGKEYEPDRLIVFAGKNNLKKWTGPIQYLRVSKIVVHPDYNYANYENDVAILHLESSVEFNDYVAPICLWDPNNDTRQLIGQKGIMAGWDYDPDVYTNEQLSYIQMAVVPNDACVLYDSKVSHLRSSRTLFCASFEQAQTCRGDTGGGLFFENYGKWYVKGLSSINIGYQDEVKCDEKHFGSFTDLSKFYGWIRNQL